MRIAIITETFLPDVNGVVTTLCRQLEHVQAAGHKAMVFAPHGGATGFYVAKRLGIPLISTYHTNFPAYSAHYGFGWARTLAYHYLPWVHNRCMLTLCHSTATIGHSQHKVTKIKCYDTVIKVLQKLIVNAYFLRFL